MRVAVLASGRGSNLAALLDQVRQGNVAATPVVVISDKPDAGALQVAAKRGVPAVALPPHEGEKRGPYDSRLLTELRRHAPDLVVLAGYMRIVGPKLIEAFEGRIINIHPSLLPAFRGLHAVRQAVAAKVERAGCTTHFVTSDLDGGPVILQASLRVAAGETEEHLAPRILRLEHLILPRTVDLVGQGRVRLSDGKVAITPGDSWLGKPGLAFVSGAHYGEGF